MRRLMDGYRAGAKTRLGDYVPGRSGICLDEIISPCFSGGIKGGSVPAGLQPAALTTARRAPTSDGHSTLCPYDCKRLRSGQIGDLPRQERAGSAMLNPPLPSIVFRFLVLSLFVSSSFAATISGKVTNYANGTPIEGATVLVSAEDLSVLTDARGRFEFTDLAVGRYVIAVRNDGFHPYSFEQTVDDADKGYRLAIELKPTITGEHTPEYLQEQPRYRMPEVTVTTTRAGSSDPVTFSNVARGEITETHYGQDTPLLLSELPNVSVYSEGGGGFGYSYLRMRGFSQDRIAVQINGVPLNDAETHEVFWVDLPDLATDLQDMQVQRGVGSSLYGPAAFGGTVNLVTRTPGLGDRPMIRAEGMYGTWATRRAMILLQSGKVADRYGFTARLTRMDTDGYRFDSWAKLWSYYLAGARFTNAHTTKLVFYGGPERVHLAYDGISKEYLDGKITGNSDNDRRYNPFTYPEEVDQFFQPHYELHDEWKLSDKLQLDNSFYVFKGDGYYDQWRTDVAYQEYFYNGGIGPDINVNILRRRNVDEIDGGWIPRLNIEHTWGETTVGGELRLHDAQHEGLVLWSDYIQPGNGPDYRYYDYKIVKRSFSGYVHNLINIAPRLSALADVQAVTHTLHMQDDNLWGVHYEKDYAAMNPRVGLNYLLVEGDTRVNRPAGTVYASLSFAQREPKPRDIYDPQDYWSLPIQTDNAPRFRTDGDGYEYIGPSLEPERLTNLEAGTHWQWSRGRIGLNAYYMALRDAIVPYGALDNLGVPKTINAKETVHQGLELVAAWSPLAALSLSGNLALTDHRFIHHKELVWDNDSNWYVEAKRDGNRIGFDPIFIANERVEYAWRGLTAGVGMRTVGKQYIDNSENETTAVPMYTLVSLNLGYRLENVPSVRAVELSLHVTNLFDHEYVSFGYDYGEALYFVGAPRAMYVTTAVEL